MSKHLRNLIAQDPAGDFVNIKCSGEGELKTDFYKSAFGEAINAELNPVIQEAFPYTVNSRIWDIKEVDSGTVVHDTAKAVLSTGTTAGASAEIKTKNKIKYRAGLGVCVRFTMLWEYGVGADFGGFTGIGDGMTDGLYVANENGVVSIRHENNSVIVGEIEQKDWDDPCDGTVSMPAIDWSKGNMCEIRYQYMGYGNIRFYIENKETSAFQLVHTFKYAGSNTEPSLSNATFPFIAQIFNDVGGVVDAKLKTASVGCFVEGKSEKSDRIKNTYTISKTASVDETAVFTLRNNDTFNTIENNSIVCPTYLSISNIESKTAIIRLTTNTTLGGAPAYTDVDTKTSLVAEDTAGTTLTGGEVIITLLVGAGETRGLNLKEDEIEINPSDTLTISSDVGASTTALIYTIGWIEDQ